MRTFITIIFVLIFSKFDLIACSCIGKSDFQKEYQRSKIVVIGKLVLLEVFQFKDSIKLEQNTPETTVHNLKKATILLSKIYKGFFKSDTIIIYTGWGKGDCGFSFKMDESYIIYASEKPYFKKYDEVNNQLKSQEHFWTSTCYRTMRYDSFEEKLLDNYVENDVFIDYEIHPRYSNGSESDMLDFISHELRVPSSLTRSGTTYVDCKIDTVGKIKEITISKGLNSEADKEAIRVVKLLEFKTGYLFGKPKEMTLTIPVVFKIKSDYR